MNARFAKISAAIAALALAAGGCAAQPEASKVASTNASTSLNSYRPLGVVVLVDGTVGVVDMLHFDVVQQIKIGHSGVHQVAMLPGNRTFYTGNLDDNTIVKVTLSDDGKTNKQQVVTKSPINLHLLTSSPDGKFVVITSRLELRDTMVLPSSGLPDDSIAILDTATDKIIKVLPLQSPAMAAFPTDGKQLFVNNVHDGSVSVIDTATWTETARWNVADAPTKALYNGEKVISPDGLDVSPDGKWLAAADYDLRTITVWEVGNPANKRKIAYKDGEGLPHDVRFSPDGKELWATDYDRHPSPAQEVDNNNIKTHIRIFDTVTLAQLRAFQPARKVQRISLPQYNKDIAFLTTGVGSVLMIDRATGAMQGEALIGGLGRPVVCGMTTY